MSSGLLIVMETRQNPLTFCKLQAISLKLPQSDLVRDGRRKHRILKERAEEIKDLIIWLKEWKKRCPSGWDKT